MKIFLKKGRAGCYTKLPTVQDMLQPIPGLISLAMWWWWRWRCLMHVENGHIHVIVRSTFEGSITSCIHPSHFQKLLLHWVPWVVDAHTGVYTLVTDGVNLHNPDENTPNYHACNQWLRQKSMDWLMYWEILVSRTSAGKISHCFT